MLNATTSSKQARLESARKWIELAIAGGSDPYMIQQQNGRWGLEQCKVVDDLPRLPRGHWDELFEVCKSLGRVIPNKEAAS